jgi:hypothetical protein
LNPVQKLSLKVLEFKKCDKIRTKGFKFGRTWFKPIPRKLSHKFLNVKIGMKGSFKKEELHSTHLNT